MTVRSQNIPSNATRKQSALFHRGQLVRSRGKVERILAILIWGLSALGTIVALHGGWEPVLAHRLSIAAILGGLIIQAVLSWTQWAYGDSKGNFLYLFSLGIDIAYTIYGYGPPIAPWIAVLLASRGIPEPLLSAWLLIALVSFFVAWYPEDRLVD